MKRARDRQLRDREEKMLALAVVVVCAIAVSAMAGQLPHRAGLIGAAAAVPATTTTPASPTSPRPLPLAAVDLHITLWPHGPASASRSWRITCPGTGCAAARARSHDLITEPTGTCGPGNNGAGEALIIGRMGRHLVDDWLDHRDSCNVARWHTLQRVLRPPVR